MNGWAFAAVAVVCLTVAFVAVLWAVVRSAARTERSVSEGPQVQPVRELSAQEEFEAVRVHNAAGQSELRRQIAEATERARREREGGF